MILRGFFRFLLNKKIFTLRFPVRQGNLGTRQFLVSTERQGWQGDPPFG
jgi:hypothetical protein